MTPEGKVKKEVKSYLQKEGIFHFMTVPCGYGMVGVPDILACVPVLITPNMVGMTVGVFMGVETKAPGKIKNTTPNQKRMLTDLANCRGVSVVTTDKAKVEEAVKLLRDVGIPMYYVP